MGQHRSSMIKQTAYQYGLDHRRRFLDDKFATQRWHGLRTRAMRLLMAQWSAKLIKQREWEMKVHIALLLAAFLSFMSSAEAQDTVAADNSEDQLSVEDSKEIIDRINNLEHKIDALINNNPEINTLMLRCNQAAQGFSIEKTPDAFNVLYRGALVYSLAGHKLREEVFGGKSPYIECEQGLSSNEMFTMVLGWKRDLLMAFGIIRQNGRVVGVQKVEWFPHDSAFSPISLQPNNEYFVRFGRLRDLNVRICWNAKGDNRWTFSPQHRVSSPQPCSTENAPYGARQTLISVQSPAALSEE